MSDYEKLLATALQCGLKIISDDFCCKLLAWLYVYGGGREETTQDGKMRDEIIYAQSRLNLYGGEAPDKELSGRLRQYIDECGPVSHPARPCWVDEIDKRYGIKTH